MFEGPRVLLKRRLRRDMRLIEIGPLHRPLIAKRDGWNTCIVDKKSRTGLVDNYSELGTESALIEEVDVIWGDEPLHEAFDPSLHQSFDAIICSHVVEHLVDPIAFFAAATRLLRPGGELLLMLPDKRFSFDYFRPLTMTGDLFEAHRTQATGHALRTPFNQHAYAVHSEGRLCWSLGRTRKLAFVSNLDNAVWHADDLGRPSVNASHDYHAWCFVPASFELLTLELKQLGLIDLAVEQITPTRHGEFFIALTSSKAQRLEEGALDAERQRLLRATMREAAQQLRLARVGGLLGPFVGLFPEIIVAAVEQAAHYAAVKLEPLFRLKLPSRRRAR